MKKNILFLCGANSCRSQMAEGWGRALAKPSMEIHSAGRFASHVQPRAVEAMKERGVDISKQWSKTPDEIPVREWAYIVTLCAEGADFCPAVPGGGKRVHWPIPDPAQMAGDPGKIMDSFRKVRDDLERRVRNFFQEIS